MLPAMGMNFALYWLFVVDERQLYHGLMTELHRALSANLKVLRHRWGYSQAELAERGAVSVSYVGELEVGVKWPSAETLQRLAAALHVQPYQLLLSAEETLAYRDWLERRDLVGELAGEFGEKLLTYLKNQQS
jgi:transcriptional regulator with XRE-family HTH domain